MGGKVSIAEAMSGRKPQPDRQAVADQEQKSKSADTTGGSASKRKATATGRSSRKRLATNRSRQPSVPSTCPRPKHTLRAEGNEINMDSLRHSLPPYSSTGASEQHVPYDPVDIYGTSQLPCLQGAVPQWLDDLCEDDLRRARTPPQESRFTDEGTLTQERVRKIPSRPTEVQSPSMRLASRAELHSGSAHESPPASTPGGGDSSATEGSSSDVESPSSVIRSTVPSTSRQLKFDVEETHTGQDSPRTTTAEAAGLPRTPDKSRSNGRKLVSTLYVADTAVSPDMQRNQPVPESRSEGAAPSGAATIDLTHGRNATPTPVKKPISRDQVIDLTGPSQMNGQHTAERNRIWASLPTVHELLHKRNSA